MIAGLRLRTAYSALVTRLITTCWSSWPRPSTGGAVSSRRCRNSTFSARSTRWRISAVSRAPRALANLGVVVQGVVDLPRGGLRVGAAREPEQAAHDPGGPIH